MGVSALPKVVEALLDAGMDPDTPAAMVERGTTSAQRRVVSTLVALTEDVDRSGLGPPALFVIGPTVRHASRLDWYGRAPLAGQRIITSADHGDIADRLEDAGAEVLRVPLPVSEAARVVMAALPLTGCVACGRADVDWLDDERGTPGWGPDVVAWCVGREAVERAVERGWPRIEQIEDGTGCAELVVRIAAGAVPG
jgi:hypothetical protein